MALEAMRMHYPGCNIMWYNEGVEASWFFNHQTFFRFSGTLNNKFFIVLRWNKLWICLIVEDKLVCEHAIHTVKFEK